MAVCAVVDGSGVVSVSSTPVDQCTSYLLLSPSDYQQVNLSAGDLDVLLPVVILVFVVAFGLRLIRRVLFH